MDPILESLTEHAKDAVADLACAERKLSRETLQALGILQAHLTERIQITQRRLKRAAKAKGGDQ